MNHAGWLTEQSFVRPEVHISGNSFPPIVCYVQSIPVGINIVTLSHSAKYGIGISAEITINIKFSIYQYNYTCVVRSKGTTMV